MTVEIRELIIQARVVADDAPAPTLVPVLPQTLSEQEWVDRIARQVLEQLREQGWGLL